MGKERENYGDLLSKYLIEKISGKKVKWKQPKKKTWYNWNKKIYLAVGSIVHHATKNSIVWGSGIIDQQQEIAAADFRAVRGPQTRKYLLASGYNCPEVYGDPALLLPEFFNPTIEKKYEIGIIPHYLDFELVSSWYKDNNSIKVIDLMTLDVEEVTVQILSCKQTISSSLHGIIVSHAYGIPSVWVKFSDKIFGNDIKYKDYLQSVNLEHYQPEMLKSKLADDQILLLLEKHVNLPEMKDIKKLQEGLLKSCPFRNR
ncbi:polysaccharide pyruvyl transferase family protein [Christiangramia portivictoriae]|uniref:polysaccharide pyruvyl transferase family protein n=1 Tax=Christiangramia portivictoriae TaxID=326069 RepID=UPI000686AD63|nr:polysaccharide pyruvyl transferase family protein [Christiangramia portivictoriae]